MPKEIDPDLKQAYEALIEERKKLADPRRIYTRSDQLYPDPRFRPDYIDPSMEEPVYQGIAPGGAEESEMSPIDFITPGMLSGGAKVLAKGAKALVNPEVKEASSKGLAALIGSLRNPKPTALDIANAEKSKTMTEYGPRHVPRRPERLEGDSLNDLYNKVTDQTKHIAKTRGNTGDARKDRIIELLRSSIRRGELKNMPVDAMVQDNVLNQEVDRLLSLPREELAEWLKSQTEKEAEQLRNIRLSRQNPKARFGGPMSEDEPGGTIGLAENHPSFQKIKNKLKNK